MYRVSRNEDEPTVNVDQGDTIEPAVNSSEPASEMMLSRAAAGVVTTYSESSDGDLSADVLLAISWSLIRGADSEIRSAIKSYYKPLKSSSHHSCGGGWFLAIITEHIH